MFKKDREKDKKMIEIFKSKMEETFKEKDLKNMNNNLLTLETTTYNLLLSKILQHLTDTNGCYNTDSNQIKIYQEDDTIYHELLHLSCNNRKNENNIIGFDHHTIKEKHILSFGVGLNEIYTEILTNRLFGKEIIDPASKTIELVLLLEQLIDDLPSLYLNSDLYELVIKLSKYTNINESLDFIYNIDRLFEIEMKNNIRKRDKEKYRAIYQKTLYFLKQYQYKRNYQEQKKKLKLL